jgi:Protein of unknown function (DUF3179)
VIGVVIDGDARAYPLRILIWHEIVNDVVGGVPVAVTYCPLCNTGIAFDRRVGEQVLELGTTGKLRNSDLVMYDRATESWWQQFLGEAIVGELTGARLTMLPSRLESFANFRERAPEGQARSWPASRCGPTEPIPTPATTAPRRRSCITARCLWASRRLPASCGSATRRGASIWCARRRRSR